jgi:hypothetical protein
MTGKLKPHLVTEQDARPAGKPDECFYCRRRIGERHKFECVLVEVPRTYRVLLDRKDVGTWSREDPASWDRDMRYFHKNESCWCANNMKDQGTLNLNEGAVLPFDNDEGERSYVCTLCNHVELVPVDGEPEYEEDVG